MSNRLDYREDFELVSRNASSDEDDVYGLHDDDYQPYGNAASSYVKPRKPLLGSLLSQLSFSVFRRNPSQPYTRIEGGRRRRKRSFASRRPVRLCSRSSRRCCFWVNALVTAVGALVVLTAIFHPSYTHPPTHYHDLRQRAVTSSDYGRANPENQKVFVAASLYDKGGHLLKGAWGQSVLDLLDLLGNKNVYLSIYENQSDGESETASFQFEKKVQCDHSVVYDKQFSIDEVPTLTLPDGSERTKRIAYLAEVRNKALLPLEDDPSVKYDKLLFLNDILFDPVDAAQLLFSTNQNSQGQATYRAACAVDFINPFKFYDTFASRDFEGYSMGVPFFPWFSSAGHGLSRQDVLAQRDAVRVKSCWGGMVAFDARPFQAEPPLRFRATEDVYWDASECCLIHADLANSPDLDQSNAPGIYMNPYVRVAYSNSTREWLPFTRRLERLYSPVHYLVNRLVGLPWHNPRREEKKGQTYKDKVWIPDNSSKTGGSYQMESRTAVGDGFCGIRALQLVKATPREGDKNWEMVPVPPG